MHHCFNKKKQIFFKQFFIINLLIKDNIKTLIKSTKFLLNFIKIYIHFIISTCKDLSLIHI